MHVLAAAETSRKLDRGGKSTLIMADRGSEWGSQRMTNTLLSREPNRSILGKGDSAYEETNAQNITVYLGNCKSLRWLENSVQVCEQWKISLEKPGGSKLWRAWYKSLVLEYFLQALRAMKVSSYRKVIYWNVLLLVILIYILFTRLQNRGVRIISFYPPLLWNFNPDLLQESTENPFLPCDCLWDVIE